MNRRSGFYFGIAAMTALVCLLGIVQAGAWDQADLARLLETKECK